MKGMGVGGPGGDGCAYVGEVKASLADGGHSFFVDRLLRLQPEMKELCW